MADQTVRAALLFAETRARPATDRAPITYANARRWTPANGLRQRLRAAGPCTDNDRVRRTRSSAPWPLHDHDHLAEDRPFHGLKLVVPDVGEVSHLANP